MKKIGIIPNLDKDSELLVTKKIIDFLEKNDCEPLISELVAFKIKKEKYTENIENIYKNSDFLIVLGGDGTILSVGRKAAVYNTPLLGINMGRLGFLSDAEENSCEISLKKVLLGEYKTEKRMMIEATILTNSTASEDYIALNDICITRGVFSKIVDLDVFVNEEYLDTYRADGIITSTPTGSTAYNLSAGGPILKPDSEMVAITPICPHALHARSIVVSSGDIVKVKVGKNSRGSLLLSTDGQTGTTLKNEDVIQIKKSKYYTSIIKTNELGFYSILREKLLRNGG